MAEVDFVFQNNDKIIPLEVKSGTNRNLKSLRSFEQKNSPEIIVRTSPRNFEHRDNFYNIPLYWISKIKNLV
jgi:predicted AAA+ superfamily ATPase